MVHLSLSRNDAELRAVERTIVTGPQQLCELDPQLLDLERLELYRGPRCLQLLWQASANARRAAWLSGSSAVASDMSPIYPEPHWPTRIEKGSVLCHTNTGCGFRSTPIQRLDQHGKLRRCERRAAA
jgi:hypothetical protein